MRHTPGPWKWEGYLLVRNCKTRGKRVAVAEINTTAHLRDGEREANMRLIEAAPKLYDSLKEIMSGQLWTDAERFRRARALFAKIEGNE